VAPKINQEIVFDLQGQETGFLPLKATISAFVDQILHELCGFARPYTSRTVPQLHPLRIAWMACWK